MIRSPVGAAFLGGIIVGWCICVPGVYDLFLIPHVQAGKA